MRRQIQDRSLVVCMRYYECVTHLNIVPRERVAILAVGRIAKVQVGQNLYGEFLLGVRMRVLALGGRARREGLLAAGARDAQRAGRQSYITLELHIFRTCL